LERYEVQSISGSSLLLDLNYTFNSNFLKMASVLLCFIPGFLSEEEFSADQFALAKCLNFTGATLRSAISSELTLVEHYFKKTLGLVV
jgi:hypothetical protein